MSMSPEQYKEIYGKESDLLIKDPYKWKTDYNEDEMENFYSQSKKLESPPHISRHKAKGKTSMKKKT